MHLRNFGAKFIYTSCLCLAACLVDVLTDETNLGPKFGWTPDLYRDDLPFSDGQFVSSINSANVISLHACEQCQQMLPEHKLSNHPDFAWKSQILTNICDQDRKKSDFNICSEIFKWILMTLIQEHLTEYTTDIQNTLKSSTLLYMKARK